MCLASTSLQSIVKLWPDIDTRDMLPQRCSSCGCAEYGAAGVPLRFQMQVQRTMRLMSVCLVLLLGVALGSLVLLLFGSPTLLRQSKKENVVLENTVPEAVKEKLQSDVSHPSAHLTIKDNSQLEWENALGNAHAKGGMTYNGGRLNVPLKGWYRVYLQITFDFSLEKDSGMCDSHILYLNITVSRFSNSYQNFWPLLVSQDTMSCQHDWTRTLYTSGIFELDAQTQLHVTIQHSQLVTRFDDPFSFFGAELVSSQ